MENITAYDYFISSTVKLKTYRFEVSCFTAELLPLFVKEHSSTSYFITIPYQSLIMSDNKSFWQTTLSKHLPK